MKSSVYTRTGDAGTTSLVDGSRVPKHCQRIEAYGTIDELNSFIGVLIESRPLDDSDKRMLTAVQNVLFSIGAYLATAEPDLAAKLLPDLDAPIKEMEAEIDRLDETLPRHNKFVLPQGSPSCAAAHVARAVTRRAERVILALNDSEPVNPNLLKYINRLSDYLFVLSRHCCRLANGFEIYWGE